MRATIRTTRAITETETVDIGATVIVGKRYTLNYNGRAFVPCAVSIDTGEWAGMWACVDVVARDDRDAPERFSGVAATRNAARDRVALTGIDMICTTRDLLNSPRIAPNVPKRIAETVA